MAGKKKPAARSPKTEKAAAASAGKSRSAAKKPPARAAAFPNALAQLAPKGSTKPEARPLASSRSAKSAKKPRPGLFQ